MNRHFLLITVAAIFTFGCNTASKPSTEIKTTITSATWITNEYNMVDSDDKVGSPYTFFKFFDDSTFNGVALRGFFTGKWQFKSSKQQIWIYPDSNYFDMLRTELIVLEIFKNNSDEMEWGLMEDFDGSYSKKFAVMNMKAAIGDATKDPLNKAFNQFRQKPSSSESAEAIKIRVKNYLSFLESFSLFSAENNTPMPEINWFPSPLVITSEGAIRMAYSDELKDWSACFFSEAQAVEGYQLMSGPLLQLKLKRKENIHLRNAAFIEELNNAIK